MTATTIATSTFRQRDRIRAALKEAGRPTAYLTDEHADLCAHAGIEPQYGVRMDTFLRGISYSGAARLLTAIRQIEEIA